MDITRPKPQSINWQFIGSGVLVVLGLMFATRWLPGLLRPETFGGDWIMAFRPAIGEMFSGRSPFTVPGFLHPPWMLVLMAPFALLPYPFDVISIILAGAAAFVYALRRLGASWLVVALFMLTPQLAWSLFLGNSDWLIALGFVLPPPIGLVLASVKPQASIALAVFWVIEAWRTGGWRKAAAAAAPTAALTLTSFVLYGFWIGKMDGNVSLPFNVASSWPHLVPVGLVLLVKAIRDRKQGLSVAASPFFAPYVNMSSLPLAIMGLLPHEQYCMISVFGLWLAWVAGSL